MLSRRALSMVTLVVHGVIDCALSYSDRLKHLGKFHGDNYIQGKSWIVPQPILRQTSLIRSNEWDRDKIKTRNTSLRIFQSERLMQLSSEQ